MGIDIDTSRKWMALHQKAQSLIPSIMDQAAQSGDYSQVDRASQLMDRITALGDHHAQQIGAAQQQDQQQQGIAMAETPSPMAPIRAQDAPSAIPKLTDESSQVHEAARGATKGAIEALQQGGSALPSLGYAPGALGLQATPSPAPSQEEQARVAAKGGLGYAPGELSMAAQYPSALPPVDEDENVGAGTLMERARKQREAAEDREGDVALEQAKRIQKDSALPDDFSDIDTALEQAKRIQKPEEEEDDSKLGAGDLLEKARKLREGSSLPDVTETAEPESALPSPEAEKPAEGSAVPSEADEGAQLDKFAQAAPGLTRKYQNNGVQLARDFIQQGALTDMEREYARRVMNELGPRPKLATVPKMLAALAVGVGSALGGWISGRYNGQALMDMGADQREWDRQRAEIGKEVYHAHKLWDKVAMQMAGQMDRTQLQEAGKGARQQVGEAGKNSRLETQEAGKDSRLDTQESGKNTRQKAALESHERIANIRATAAKHGDQMSISDKAELTRLGRAYSGIDRTLMTVDPKVKAQGDEVLRQMEEIVQKYRDMGK